MRILFIVYHGFGEANGISKKIHNQVKGLRRNGHEVSVCYYSVGQDGHRRRFVDDEVIQDYGTGRIAALRQRTDYGCVLRYCLDHGIDFVYARDFMNASPPLIRLFRGLRRAGIRAVTEIPTYPYDGELVGFPLPSRIGFWINRLFRRRLARQMDAVVTFSEATEIFGQRTINISNGVDFDSVALHDYHPDDDGAVHLVGVAEVHFWHGYDRIIAGLGEYYAHGGRRSVYFHIVGGIAPGEMYGSKYAQGFAVLMDRYNIRDHVIFHGPLHGSELDDVFNISRFAIGSLGRHRSGITTIKTLKNREYATRGIPFIYSEHDSDFDNRYYVMKAPADESPVDIGAILDFTDSHKFRPQDIRDTVEHLSWTEQMRLVTDAVAGGGNV